MPTNTILSLHDVKIAYGAIQAVRGIDLHVNAGELVTLIGANGAGKTTTLNAIAGTLKIAEGQILYQGEPVHKLPAYRRLRKGLALVPEGRGIFTRLTVEENLQLGAFTRNDADQIHEDMEKIFTMLPRVKERLHQVAGTLSGGEQQMVAISRAILSRPKLLLLDEPSMGLAPQVVEQIFGVIRSVVETGVAVLLVEQNAHIALEFSDRGYVMDTGSITLAGSGAELLDDPRVRAAYLGIEEDNNIALASA